MDPSFWTRGVWRYPDFRLYWLAASTSSFGSVMSAYALPMAVVITFHGGPQDTARLMVFQAVGGLLGALLAGFLVKARAGQRVLVASYGAMVAVLAVPPLLFWAGHLKLWHLLALPFFVAFAASFGAAGQPLILPRIVQTHEIPEANNQVWIGVGISLAAGPILAGFLVHFITPVNVIGVVSLLYLFSAAAISKLQLREEAQGEEGPSAKTPAWTHLFGSIAWSLRHPSVAALLFAKFGGVLFTGMAGTVAMYYRLEGLHLSPAEVGFIGSLASPGFLLGPLITGLLVRRLGPGRVALVGAIGVGLGSLALPAARGSLLAIFAILVVGGILGDMAAMAYGSMEQALYQMIVPSQRRPQVASFQVTLSNLGTLLGPVLGLAMTQSLPSVTILWISGAGMILTALPMAFTPLMQRVPVPAPEEGQRAPSVETTP